MSIQISIIIPTYNRAEQLKKCLESLFNQNFNEDDFEILVINDGSIDGTKNLGSSLQKEHKTLRYFFQKNKGPAAARNLGIKKARGKILAFTDDDCIVSKDWFENIIQQKFDILGGKTEVPNYSTSLIFQYLSDLSIWHKNNIIFLPTNNLAVKKEVFDKVGFFDETNLYAAGEDTEWCWRTFKKGFKLKFNKDMQVGHNYSPSFKNFLKKSYRYGKGNYLAKLKCRNHPKLRDIKIGKGFYFQIFKNFIKSPHFAYIHSRIIGKKHLQCFWLLVLFVWLYNYGLARQHYAKLFGCKVL